MKYYSETLDKLFESEKELQQAEKNAIEAEAKKKELEEVKRRERAEDAKEVEIALKNLRKAEDEYHEKLNAFIKKYGYYHYTSHDARDFPSAFSLIEPVLNWL